ncbi:hypothetical protein EVAR_77480_1 [Eumeta japonica]|uniref:Uncharacterized protein n=1 Tax=Eumeta variegata TaxID=151549 RepID=A0A4C1T760_EUMVA|nr:hypothetical protein EVAR_77480_1 [Eumeta japonica]
MQSNADDRVRQTEIETTTTRGADRADERQSAEDCGEELNISINDSNTTSSSPQGGEGGDTMSRGCDSTEAENEDANSRARPDTAALPLRFAIKSKLKSSTSALTKKLLIFYIEEAQNFVCSFCCERDQPSYEAPVPRSPAACDPLARGLEASP